MKFRRHHGKEKIGDISEIEAVNIVLTTYHSISADWMKNAAGNNIMFSVRWKRIILDEGKEIRVRSAETPGSKIEQLILFAI